jgi:FkbM family methyltransferase
MPGQDMFRRVTEALEARHPVRGQPPLDTVLFPAGKWSRALLAHGLPAGYRIVGMADSQPAPPAGPFQVLDPEDLKALRPALILVASTRFRGEILEGHGPAWRDLGIEVVDLCAELGPWGALCAESWRLGLELDDTDPETLSITHPGPPMKRIVYARGAGDNTEWMLQGFDAFFASIAPDSAGPDGAVIDLSRPGYHTLLPSGARLFYPSMVESEDTIRPYLDFARLKPGDQVLDLGAYAGDSTLFFARAVGPEGCVLAVEPDPASFAALDRNVRELGLANVAVEASAILDRDGSVPFQARGSIGSGISEASDHTGSETLIPTLTLDTLLARHRMARVDFIKMDIEGAEERVLRGNADLLRRLRPRMIVESHSHQGRSNRSRLVSLLEGWGCSCRLENVLILAEWPPTR